MTPVNDFVHFSSQKIIAALAKIDRPALPDIYALSFFVYDDDDDPRYPVLQVGYNTLTQVGQSTAETSSTDEAKWNFAFWLQNELEFIGLPETESAQLLERNLRARGLWYSDDDEDADFDRCMEIGRQITAYFVEACVRIARALHDSGFIEKQFSRPIPIIVHELEYYDKIAAQTRSANPAGLANEFKEWIVSLY